MPSMTPELRQFKPGVYERFFRGVAFPLYESILHRRDTSSYVAECERNQWLNPTELQALQLRKLNELLSHCWQHVPFLQRHWRAAGLNADALTHVDALTRYPLMTKQLMTENYADMVAVPWRGKTISKSTSGSTSEPFRFEYTQESYARRYAAAWRGYAWAGAGLGASTVYLWGASSTLSVFKRLKESAYHRAFNRYFINANVQNTESLDHTIAELQKRKPQAIVGFVSPLALLAQRMLDTGKTIPGLRGVVTAAEALYAHEREIIEKAFGCPAYNTYGSREVMLMAAECGTHHSLHVTADQLVLETVNRSGERVNGEIGEVAVTDLHNFGMPFVRYLNGDRAKYSPVACGCGRSLPVLSSIDGRVLDLIETPDGHFVSGEAFIIVFLGFPGVKRHQAVQIAPNRLQVRVILAPDWSVEQNQALLQQLQELLGPSMEVQITPVTAIADTPGGKRRTSVSFKNLATLGENQTEPLHTAG